MLAVGSFALAVLSLGLSVFVRVAVSPSPNTPFAIVETRLRVAAALFAVEYLVLKIQ